jgi:hypothetical protein
MSFKGLLALNECCRERLTRLLPASCSKSQKLLPKVIFFCL